MNRIDATHAATYRDDLSYRYFEQIGRALTSGVLPASIEGPMGRTLAAAIGQTAAHLSVTTGPGREIAAAAADRYLSLAAQLLPLLDGDVHAASTAARLRAWRDGIAMGESLPDLLELEKALGDACAFLIARHKDSGAFCIGQLLAGELSRREQIDALTAKALAAPEGTGQGRSSGFSTTQIAALGDFLGRSCGATMPIVVVDMVPVPGGFSKQTFFCRLSASSVLPGEVVLRYDAADSVIGTSVRGEFGILKVLHARGVRVAEPYALEDSGKVLGAPFMITARASGGSIGDSYRVEKGSVAFGTSLAQELAKIHGVELDAFGYGIYGSDVGTRARMLAEIRNYRDNWRNYGYASIAMDCAFEWLEQNIDAAEGRRTLIHRDIGCHNTVVDNDRVSAIIDWETAAVGNPAQDVGYAKKTIIQMMPWEDFLAAYAAAGGIVPSQREIDFYDLWGATWVTVHAAQARFYFVNGHSDNILLAYAGEHILKRDLLGMAARMSRIYSSGKNTS